MTYTVLWFLLKDFGILKNPLTSHCFESGSCCPRATDADVTYKTNTRLLTPDWTCQSQKYIQFWWALVILQTCPVSSMCETIEIVCVFVLTPCVVVWGFCEHLWFYKLVQFPACVRLLKIIQSGAIGNVYDVVFLGFVAAFCCYNVNITRIICTHLLWITAPSCLSQIFIFPYFDCPPWASQFCLRCSWHKEQKSP